jgi:asparagine synthase (glutamine-hydrolysing)
VPIGAWIARRGSRLGPLVAAQPGVAALADPGRVAALFREGAARGPQASACWALLFYALWHRRHILGLPPAGDTFDTLAAL